MAAEDLGRDAFDPRKRYAAVRMQQGRVTLDDDFNEDARIDAEDDRRERIDVIGPAGSPDEGFLPFDGTTVGTSADFKIRAGTFYLGGLRVENFEDVHFLTQPDFLEQPLAEKAAGAPGMRDFLYLEVWQQPITAVEDGELFEVGLGGPDTSARIRTMWRLRRRPRLLPAIEDCEDAWAELKAQWVAQHLGTISARSNERVVDARLQVGFLGGSASGDLCQPSVAGGYLGADNQAIRVEIIDGTHFTWGFDNASPLYRVEIDLPWPSPTTNVTVTLLTDPKDQAHWPMANQIAEILPWSAVLPNNEKIAELSGHVARITGSYDPDLKTITLDAIPATGVGFTDWTTRPDAPALSPPGSTPHFYMRVWNRGSDVTSPPKIPFVPGTAVPLGNTGLQITFTGTDFVRGDHWIIAARPETPNRVVPWSLEVTRGPHGVHRFYAPIAIIQWKLVASQLTFDVLHDCRPTFLPLTQRNGCCTYTVGDASESFGQFDTIQKAIDNLPPTGGKICVLPGEYRESVSIIGKHGVTIEGCGARTRVLAPDAAGSRAFFIMGSTDVAIRSLHIDAGEQRGVVIRQSGGPTPVTGDEDATEIPPDVGPGSPLGLTRNIVLDQLGIETRGGAAIYGWGGRFVTVRRCRIVARLDQPLGGSPDPHLGRWPSVALHCDDVVIEDNHIVGLPTTQYMSTPFGGIQIGGGSERWLIQRNKIHGGSGDGVTLGSWTWAPASTVVSGEWFSLLDELEFIAPGTGFFIEIDCIHLPWFPTAPDNPDDPADPMVPVSVGALRDIRIVDNDISRMGRAGVGVVRWFNLEGEDEVIVVDRIAIENNRIRQCVQLPATAINPPEMIQWVARGAITLQGGALAIIRDNVIEENGRSHVDPICGIFAIGHDGLLIDRNRIVDNAPATGSPDSPRTGWRDAITLLFAYPPSVEVDTGLDVGAILRQSGVPAVRVHDNVVVQPEGRALFCIAFGPVSVADNQLTSRGTGTATATILDTGPGGGASPASILTFADALGGCAAFILGFGESNENGDQIDMFRSIGPPAPTAARGLDRRDRVAAGGTVLFNDNKIVLDLLGARPADVLSSVLVVSGDDACVDGNQLVIEEEADRVRVNAMSLGVTARITNNRLTERLDPNVVDVLSAFAFGAAAAAVANISTHCLIAMGSTPDLELKANNLVLSDPGPEGCGNVRGAAAELFDMLRSNRS